MGEVVCTSRRIVNGEISVQVNRFPLYSILQETGGSCCAIKSPWASFIAHFMIWACSGYYYKGFRGFTLIGLPLLGFPEVIVTGLQAG